MKMIRAVFRHSLLLAIVVGAGVAYYYRDDLLPKFYEKVAELRSLSGKLLPGKGAEEEPPEAEKVVIADSTVADAQPVTELAPATADVPEKDTADSSEQAEEAVAPAVEPVPPVAQVPAEVTPPAPDLSRYRPLEEEETAADVVSAPVPDTEVAPSVSEPDSWAGAQEQTAPLSADSALTPEQPAPMQQTAPLSADSALTPEQPAPMQQKAPLSGDSALTLEQTRTSPVETGVEPGSGGTTPPAVEAQEKLRASARSAFWRHDYQQAESDYKALTAMGPSDPDAYGELGNVYFSQGKWELAADAFYEAGIRLVSMGQAERARSLLVIIRGLNPEKAQQLEQQLTQAQGGAGN